MESEEEMRVLKVLKKPTRKSDGAEDDLKAAKQLENAAYTALRKSAQLLKKAGSVEDAPKHLKAVLGAIRALDEAV